MISMKEFMELVDHKITEGGDYGWQCFGSNSYQLSHWNGVHGKGGWSANIVFSTRSQKVYTVEVCDYTNDRAYRIINPDYVKKYNKESKDRGELGNQAWDGIDFVDLDVDDDFIQKFLAIKSGEGYDTRVQLPVDFSDEDLLRYMKLAHERDITFNELVTQALTEAIQLHKSDPERFGQLYND
jgi:hypothetical protein